MGRNSVGPGARIGACWEEWAAHKGVLSVSWYRDIILRAYALTPLLSLHVLGRRGSPSMCPPLKSIRLICTLRTLRLTFSTPQGYYWQERKATLVLHL